MQGLVSRALVIQDRKRRSLEAQLTDRGAAAAGVTEEAGDDFGMKVAKKIARRRSLMVPQLLADTSATFSTLQDLRVRVLTQTEVRQEADDSAADEYNDVYDDSEDYLDTEYESSSSGSNLRNDLIAVARDFQNLGLGSLSQSYEYDPRDITSANDVLALSNGAWVDGSSLQASQSAWDPNWGRPKGFTGLLFLSPHGVPILVGDGKGSKGGGSGKSLQAVASSRGDLWFQVREGRGAIVLLRASMLRGLKGSRACSQMAADLAVTRNTLTCVHTFRT